MSRSHRGAKAPGYEYWSRRPLRGPPGKFSKTKTHRAERQGAKRDIQNNEGGGSDCR